MKYLYKALLFVVLLGIVPACSDSFIDPFNNDGRYYTVYGYIDILETNHAIRVIPVTRSPEIIRTPADPDAFIDATVTSVDLFTGEEEIWRHSLEQLSDNTYGHIFRATFRPRPGRTYELTILRSDGITTTAQTTMPHLPITIPSPDTLFYPYEIAPEAAWSQDVFLPGIASPWDITVSYDLQGRLARVPYGRPGQRTEDGGWVFAIDPSADAPAMREFMGIQPGNPLPLLHAIEIKVSVLDANWDPPQGIFDPEVLAFPDEVSNVERGYGLWGAIGLYQYTWIAPPQTPVQHKANPN